jgi:hypothetical protein
MADITTQINGLSESIKQKIRSSFCDCEKKKENFADLESGLQSTVSSQNTLIDSQTDELYREIDTNNRKQTYQQKMFHNLESLNFFLQFIYAIIFILIKVLILEQYYNKTVVRDEWVDSIILTLFFLYPFLIYSFQMYLYQFIMTIVSYIYGTVNIPDFDELFSKTEFYKSPEPDPNNSRDMRNKFT